MTEKQFQPLRNQQLKQQLETLPESVLWFILELLRRRTRRVESGPVDP